MISSVQNIQTTLINAPDNVLEMVKGVSEMVLNEASAPMKSAPAKTTNATTAVTPTASSPMKGNIIDLNAQSYHPKANRTQTYSSAQLFLSNTAVNSFSPIKPSNSTVQPVTDADKQLIDCNVLNDDDMVCFSYLIKLFKILILDY